MTEITLKYRWRQTWADKPDDYVGKDPGNLDQFGNPSTIGRFYLAQIPGGMAWRWFTQWAPPGAGAHLPSGVSQSEREAAKAIEDAYDQIRDIAATKPKNKNRSPC